MMLFLLGIQCIGGDSGGVGGSAGVGCGGVGGSETMRQDPIYLLPWIRHNQRSGIGKWDFSIVMSSLEMTSSQNEDEDKTTYEKTRQPQTTCQTRLKLFSLSASAAVLLPTWSLCAQESAEELDAGVVQSQQEDARSQIVCGRHGIRVRWDETKPHYICLIN